MRYQYNYAHKIYGFWPEPRSHYEGETFNHSEILNDDDNSLAWRSHHRLMKPIVDTIFEVTRTSGTDEIKGFNEDFDSKGYPMDFFVHFLNYLDRDEIVAVTREVKKKSNTGENLTIVDMVALVKPMKEKYKSLKESDVSRIEHAQSEMTVHNEA